MNKNQHVNKNIRMTLNKENYFIANFQFNEKFYYKKDQIDKTPI